MTRRKDGRFVKVITLSSGEKKYFYSSAKTEKEATRDFDKQLLAFREKEKRRRSFPVIADEWDTEYRERVSDVNYRKNTRGAYNRIIEYFADNKDITKISALDINRFIKYLIARGYYKQTIAAHKNILNMIFNFAILNGHTTVNPVSVIRLPHNLPSSPRKMPTTEEIKEVSSHYDGFDLLPYFLLYTGLRISEALALTYADIDRTNKLITVNKHLIHNGNSPVIENRTKTVNSERKVILLDRLDEKLPKRRNGYIFCNDREEPYTKRELRTQWIKYRERYNVHLTAHQLRHAYATMLFEAGVDVKDAQELMGHSDINLTRQIYTHIRNERKEETAIKLNAFDF
ncbi:MAG: site-specific integrase [Oscillospiraceae bacterium]|nr:site-specific integrase [Oscillospiraceae bacterium]